MCGKGWEAPVTRSRILSQLRCTSIYNRKVLCVCVSRKSDQIFFLYQIIFSRKKNVCLKKIENIWWTFVWNFLFEFCFEIIFCQNFFLNFFSWKFFLQIFFLQIFFWPPQPPHRPLLGFWLVWENYFGSAGGKIRTWENYFGMWENYFGTWENYFEGSENLFCR